jgi:hypothetical protein
MFTHLSVAQIIAEIQSLHGFIICCPMTSASALDDATLLLPQANIIGENAGIPATMVATMYDMKRKDGRLWQSADVAKVATRLGMACQCVNATSASRAAKVLRHQVQQMNRRWRPSIDD